MTTARRRPRRTRLGLAFDVVSWAALAPVWGAALAWTVSGRSWRADLLANLGAQAFVVTAAAALLWLASRRRVPLVLAALACLVHLTVLARHRAAYLPRPVGGPIAAGRDPGVVRLMHYNSSGHESQEAIRALMDASDADVISILSPPVKMQFDVMYSPGLREAYPNQLNRYFEYDAVRNDSKVSAGFVVSDWPMRPYDVAWVGELSEHLIAAVVERPDALGPSEPGSAPGRAEFGLIAVHPRSPRNPDRWEEGNRVAEAAASVARRMQDEGLAVVVLSDLNATPSGRRSRRMCSEGGLARAKPLLTGTGTYPGVLSFRLGGRPWRLPGRWPVGVAIDDALVSPGVRVLGWSAGAPLGEEHRPVTVDLLVPGRARDASGVNPRPADGPAGAQ